MSSPRCTKLKLEAQNHLSNYDSKRSPLNHHSPTNKVSKQGKQGT
ncbi:unnamed protein product [Periconia digitata]|uniref:Uncharacterized protein n=1 Tax=Periconia digitata TaxID=1303443 RepID=A0A9W4XJR4_9PLEO|nr:unnamed protein product [Periconia digitata]